MRHPPYDLQAPQRAVSLTLNSDLYRQALALGINVSQVAEEALARAVAARAAEQLNADIQQDVAAMEACMDKHGSSTQMLREHTDSFGRREATRTLRRN